MIKYEADALGTKVFTRWLIILTSLVYSLIYNSKPNMME